MQTDDKTYKIIGAAMKVHQVLGSGFLESVYQEALDIELTRREIPHTHETEINVNYEDVILSKCFYADFVCYGNIIIEIKASSDIDNTHRAQIINYLKATHYHTGLLINFGASSLQYQRFVV